MAQILKNLDKWEHAVSGQAIRFPLDQSRRVTLDVNAPFDTRLYYTRPGKAKAEPVFLALVKGLDRVVFHIDHAFDLVGDADFSLYSSEFEETSFVSDEETFTTIVERRQRNPELEYIAEVMERNMQKRLAQVAGDRDALFERLEQLESANNTRAPAGGLPVGERASDERSEDGDGDGSEAESTAAGASDKPAE